MKGRGGVIIFIIIIVLVVALFFFLRRGGGLPSLFGRGATPTPTIPFDLQAIIPSSWTVQAQPQVQCDFDDDGQLELLLIYTYNGTSVPNPQPAATPDGNDATTVAFTPFGGVIYDTQPGSLQPQPDNPGPYRTSNFVPYKLLPDYYVGKGQGYLGESSVRVLFAPAATSGTGCKTTDINVYGYSSGSFPTRVSVFRWAGTDLGYQAAHFPGDARVETTTTAEGKINRAVTYNRLQNHRSVLCEVQANVRPDLNLVTFIPDASVQTIDFCFNPPVDPVYPEGVTIAVLRSAQQPTGNTQSPSYILDNAQVAAELQFLNDPNHDPVNIVALGNPSSVISVPSRGTQCTVEQVGAAADQLWCDRQRARIETRIILNGVPRDAVWIMMSVEPTDVSNATLYWRVTEIELP